MSDDLECLVDESDESCFVRFCCFLFISRLFIYFLSLDESDLLDDESDGPRYYSGSSGTYLFRAFSLRFNNSFVSVGIFGSDILAPTGVEPKDGRLLAFIWCSNY